MASRTGRLQTGMLVMHCVARFKVRRERYRTRNRETRLRGALPRENRFLCGVNTDMAAGRLTPSAYLARDVEFCPPMLGMAIRTAGFLLLVDRGRFLIGMTALAT